MLKRENRKFAYGLFVPIYTVNTHCAYVYIYIICLTDVARSRLLIYYNMMYIGIYIYIHAGSIQFNNYYVGGKNRSYIILYIYL